MRKIPTSMSEVRSVGSRSRRTDRRTNGYPPLLQPGRIPPRATNVEAVEHVGQDQLDRLAETLPGTNRDPVLWLKRAGLRRNRASERLVKGHRKRAGRDHLRVVTR